MVKPITLVDTNCAKEIVEALVPVMQPAIVDGEEVYIAVTEDGPFTLPISKSQARRLKVQKWIHGREAAENRFK